MRDAKWALQNLTRDEIDNIMRDLRIAREECGDDDREFLCRVLAAMSQLRMVLVKVL